MDLGSSLGAIRKYTLLLPKFDQKEIMKYTIVKMSEIAKHPTMRLDARYWIKKKEKKKKRKNKKSCKPQASSSKHY